MCACVCELLRQTFQCPKMQVVRNTIEEQYDIKGEKAMVFHYKPAKSHVFFAAAFLCFCFKLIYHTRYISNNVTLFQAIGNHRHA